MIKKYLINVIAQKSIEEFFVFLKENEIFDIDRIYEKVDNKINYG